MKHHPHCSHYLVRTQLCHCLGPVREVSGAIKMIQKEKLCVLSWDTLKMRSMISEFVQSRACHVHSWQCQSLAKAVDAR